MSNDKLEIYKTEHYDFKDIVVEMTPEQCYNYLRENNLVYMEEE